MDEALSSHNTRYGAHPLDALAAALLGLALLIVYANNPFEGLPGSVFWALLPTALTVRVLAGHPFSKILWAMLGVTAWALAWELPMADTPGLHGVAAPTLMGFFVLAVCGGLHGWTRWVILGTTIGGLLLVVLLNQDQLAATWRSVDGGPWRTLEGMAFANALRQVNTVAWLTSAGALFCFGASLGRRAPIAVLLWLTLAMVLGLAAVMTFARSALLLLALGIPFAAAMTAYCWRAKAAITGGALMAILFFALFSGNLAYNTHRDIAYELDPNTIGRWELYKAGVARLSDGLHPLGPVGPTSHSSFLDSWANYTPIFTFTLYGLLAILVWQKVQAARQTGAHLAIGAAVGGSAMIFLSLLDPVLFSLPGSLLLWTFAAMEVK